MGKDATAAVITASKQRKLQGPIGLVKLELDSGDVNVNDSDRPFDWDGDTYLGVGQLGAMSGVEESMELSAQGVKLALSGIPDAYVTMVLDEDYQGRPVYIWVAFLDEDYQIIANPVLVFSGFCDQMRLTSGEQAIIEVTAENELAAWERPNIARYTNAEQQNLFSGDLGLEFISQAVDSEVIWGPGPAPRTIYNEWSRSYWAQDFDAFGQPVLPDWWLDPAPVITDPGGGGGGIGGDGGGF